MRIRALIVACAALLAAIPVSSGSGAGPEGVAPAFAIGDWWKYRVTGNEIRGIDRFTVKGFEKLTIGGNEYDVVSFSFAGSGTYDDGVVMGNYHESGTYYLQQGNRAIAAQSGTFEIDAIHKTSGEEARISIDLFLSYSPPLEMAKFPLSAGQTYSQEVDFKERASVRVNGQRDPTGDIDRVTRESHTFSVSGPGKQTVDAGTFDVWEIHGTQDEAWYANDVGLFIWSMGEGGAITLMEYSYSGGGILGLAPVYFGALVLAITVPAVIIFFLVRRYRKKKKERLASGIADRQVGIGAAAGSCPSCSTPTQYSDQFKCNYCPRCNMFS